MSAEATGRPWAVDDELPPNDRTVIVRCGHAGVPISGNTSGYDASRSRASYNAEDRANAHLIVEAVNSHASLKAEVAQLRAEVELLRSFSHAAAARLLSGRQLMPLDTTERADWVASTLVPFELMERANYVRTGKVKP